MYTSTFDSSYVYDTGTNDVPSLYGLAGVGLRLWGDAALQEEIDYWVAAVFGGPEEGAFHLRLRRARTESAGLVEIIFDYVKAAQACGSFKI